MICVEWADDHFGLGRCKIDSLLTRKTIFTFSFLVTLTFDLLILVLHRHSLASGVSVRKVTDKQRDKYQNTNHFSQNVFFWSWIDVNRFAFDDARKTNKLCSQ